MSERTTRKHICRVAKLMHRFQLVDGSAGNISVRLDEDRILITPSGLIKAFLEPHQLLIIGLDGRKIMADTPETRHLKPSSESLMHLEVYRRRADVNAVIHAHPSYATALTIAGLDMQRYTIPEAITLLGTIPNAPYATPATTEEGAAIADLIPYHDAIMLSYHGSLTVGRDLWEAYARLETLEHTAKLTFLVNQLGGGQPLDADQMQKLIDMRKKMGLAHAVEPISTP